MLGLLELGYVLAAYGELLHIRACEMRRDKSSAPSDWSKIHKQSPTRMSIVIGADVQKSSSFLIKNS